MLQDTGLPFHSPTPFLLPACPLACLPAALGHNRAYHYADIFGADGKRIGRIRYGFSFRRPMDSLLKEYRSWVRSKRPSEPDPRDPAFMAVQTVRGCTHPLRVLGRAHNAHTIASNCNSTEHPHPCQTRNVLPTSL